MPIGVGVESEKNAVREQLERLLADPAFSGANRRRRLLRYLVEETLENRGDSLKESVIATEVFDRSPDYDPQVDSVVRVEVGRLRARLAEYYEKNGPDAPVRIEIPKGGYRPIFAFRESEPVAPLKTRRGFRWIAAGAAIMVIAAGALWWRARESAASGTRSIAVLPFLNLTGNASEEYLADGVSDELTEVLAEFSDLRVIARTSAFQYKGKGADVREIGRNLRVGAVLEGSLAKLDEGHVRVIAQLIRTSDGYHFWAHTYDVELAAITEVENGIALACRERLDPAAATIPHKAVAVGNPEAHDLYIRAAYELNQHTVASTRQAIELARKATEKDASFVQPYVVIATAELELSTLFAQPGDVSAKLALEAVDKALALDPENSNAHALKGLLAYTNQWDWPQAEREFRLALASGSHAAAENLYGWCLMTRGRFAESRQRLETAAELDPLSLGPQLNQVEELLAEHHDAEAKRKIDEILRIAPANPLTQVLALSVAFWQKDCPAATAFDQKIVTLFPKASKPALSTVIASATCGRTDQVAAGLAILAKAPPGDFLSPYQTAGAFAIGNDADHAMAYLQISADHHDPALMQLHVDRAFATLQQNPRFIAIERRLGLVE